MYVKLNEIISWNSTLKDTLFGCFLFHHGTSTSIKSSHDKFAIPRNHWIQKINLRCQPVALKYFDLPAPRWDFIETQELHNITIYYLPQSLGKIFAGILPQLLNQLFAAWNRHFRTHLRHNYHFDRAHVPPCLIWFTAYPQCSWYPSHLPSFKTHSGDTAGNVTWCLRTYVGWRPYMVKVYIKQRINDQTTIRAGGGESPVTPRI